MADEADTRVSVRLGVCELSVAVMPVSGAVKVSLRAGLHHGIETAGISDLDTLVGLEGWLEDAQRVVQEALDAQVLVPIDDSGRVQP